MLTFCSRKISCVGIPELCAGDSTAARKNPSEVAIISRQPISTEAGVQILVAQRQ